MEAKGFYSLEALQSGVPGPIGFCNLLLISFIFTKRGET